MKNIDKIKINQTIPLKKWWSLENCLGFIVGDKDHKGLYYWQNSNDMGLICEIEDIGHIRQKIKNIHYIANDKYIIEFYEESNFDIETLENFENAITEIKNCYSIFRNQKNN